MTKQEAADIFGGVHADLARALDMTRGGISQWPDELTDAQRDRVIGAAIRLGRQVPPRFLQPRVVAEQVPQQAAWNGPERRRQMGGD